MTAAHTRSGCWRIGAMGLALGLSFAILLSISGSARAGELAYKGCISGDERVGPKKADYCSLIPKATGKGWGSGLGGLTSITPSPDGDTLYTGASLNCYGLDYPRCIIDAAVGRFRLDSTSGGLRYRGCVTGATESGPSGYADCAEVPNATSKAVGAGLGAVSSEALSPDGRFLYAGSTYIECVDNPDYDTPLCYGSNVLTTFRVDRSTGTLTYLGCVTGDRRSGPAGSGACTLIPHATADGAFSGLYGSLQLRVSGDGRSLYAVASSSVARFNRNAATGAITYKGCITGNKGLGPSGSGACTEIGTATSDGRHSGLGFPDTLALSPDDKSLYVAGGADLASFSRNASTGALTYRGCITGSKQNGPSGSGACEQIPSATTNGGGSGLQELASLSASPDGKSLYAAGQVSVATFDRNPKTDALTYGGCLTGNSGRRSPAKACDPIGGGHRDLALSTFGSSVAAASNKTVYAGVRSGVAYLKRNPATGALSFRDCVAVYQPDERSVCTQIPRHTSPRRGPDLGPVQSLATAHGSAYGDIFTSTIAHFAIAPQTKVKGGPKGTTGKHSAVLRFGASKPSTFECKLKGKHVKSKLRHWRRCGSHGRKKDGKERYDNLGSGKKVFKVKAKDGANTTDPTPAKRSWRIR